MELSFKTITASDQLIADAIKLRIEVFVLEQKVPIELEIDEYDGHCQHLVLLADDTPIGTLRLVSKEAVSTVKLGRLVLLKAYRGKGIGKLMMQEAFKVSRKMGFENMILDAQTYALAFYEKLGFVATGNEFMDAGIPHYRMTKKLHPKI